ncbi:Myc-type basic helix-loop-helix (bHLH) domain [Arabidopsis thaliana x Arabidopsis arenosa]|uniref:Myc-type basic helix-loop-helix (BHLH) domain n=1 Tax=Arabidopsis thaliana x Arabidopsis arenosa TaxID=1240361 RepID=A0A8T2A1C3_9BRAS|nr:Myc-type basic helix-loop-helix (bHLH) domain [Arabidopsis thaliana x Arabidopsis arenosa]
MEDSSFMDLMIDTDEYLIDDWESDFPICGETNTKPGSESGSGTGFELVPERPTKQMKTNNNINSTSSSPSSSSSSSGSRTSQVISFGSPDTKTNPVETSLNFSNQVSMDEKVGSKRKDCVNNGGRREPHLLKEHVLAERKRRQKLNERLIALSALLPGLKKTDKATVLEDAIKHLKQLQERVKKLEEERVGTKNMDQSVILVKRSQVYLDDDSSSYSSTCSAASPLSSSSDEVSILKQTMPMIEARVSGRDLLITVHCEKNKGCMIKILSSLENFRLEIVNSFTLPFGNSTIVITILSKMDNKFSRPVEEVVKNIRLALAE